MSKNYLLTLIADPPLEEPLVDWLLQHEAHYGFTSSQINGHSRDHGDLTLAEQVAGRKRQIRYQMCVDQHQLDRLCRRLHKDFAGAGIRYWAVPVIIEGQV